MATERDDKPKEIELSLQLPEVQRLPETLAREAGPFPPADAVVREEHAGQPTRDPQWPDDHNPAPMTTEVVDERSVGDATGGERDPRKRLNESGIRRD